MAEYGSALAICCRRVLSWWTGEERREWDQTLGLVLEVWCFEKLENEVGEGKMGRVPFHGAVLRSSFGRFRDLGSFTRRLSPFRLHDVDLIRLLRFQHDSELGERSHSMNLAVKSLPFYRTT